MKKIKYRAWDNNRKDFCYWDAKYNPYDGIFWEVIKRPEYEKPDQFYCKDDYGNDIYANDVVRFQHCDDLNEDGTFTDDSDTSDVSEYGEISGAFGDYDTTMVSWLRQMDYFIIVMGHKYNGNDGGS